MGSFSNISNLQARESFQFKLGSNIHILSDKAFRKSKENKFEAVGNVIITQLDNAIYGEKATMSFSTGDTKVIGNVRYVSPSMTMYGTQLDYNINTNYINIKNARVLAGNYVVLGKEITRSENNIITAVDAEYTTCRDCPESWSIFGKRVKITAGEYIRIWHAFIKVKGVVIMYFPYIILPIKKNRETGLLFPSLSFQSERGMTFYLPWFWAMSPSKDMTISPSTFGKRGFGSVYQYRQVLGDSKWFELNSLLSNDTVYEENKASYDDSESATFRHISEWEHHFEFGSSFNHHFSFTNASDLDMTRDFDFFTYDHLYGSEFGGGGYINTNSSLFDLSIESYFVRNQLTPFAKEFDHSYVQILPKVSLEMAPIELIHSDIPGLRRLTLGTHVDYTIFRQNKTFEENYIRNAHRINAKPYVSWNLGHFGPVLGKTKTEYDFQYYNFPNKITNTFFKKSAFLQETEFSYEMEKVFGLSYIENLPAKELEIIKLSEVEELAQEESKKLHEEMYNKNSVLGRLPRYEDKLVEERITIKRSSYKHTQEFKLKHYLLNSEKVNGNTTFINQINSEEGQFDTNDGLRETQHQLNKENSLTSLPVSNTIEFQWNSSVIKKSSNKISTLRDNQFLRDNFYYSKIFHFNISQGYDLDIESEFVKEKLTRLYINTGYNFNNVNISGSEYFYYGTGEHLINISGSYYFDVGSITTSFSYNSFTKPVDKRISIGGRLTITDLLAFTASYSYDIEDQKETESKFGILYSPTNGCWKLGIDYKRSLIEKRIGLNLLINFNENSFTSLSDF
ncbi:MAG: LPS-assembly protein LptD [Bacteriovoracaceae bacterium]|nr:LPS-assembly protein LptD [Bacteriovoracaceae bacterium]